MSVPLCCSLLVCAEIDPSPPVAVLWGVYGECTNHAVLSGHKNAILQVKWGASSG